MRKFILLLFVISACTSRIPTIHSGHKVMERKYYEVLGAGGSLRNTSAATLALWIRPKGDSPTNQDLFNLSVGGPKEMDFKSRAGFRIIPNGAFQSVARADDNEELSEITTAPGLARKNVWQHVALTIDYAGKKQEFFVDGKKVASQGTNIFTKPRTSDTHSQRVTLGAEDDGSLAFFYGDLTGAFVEQRILSENEILDVMKKTRP